MGLPEILLIIACAAVVIGVITASVVRKKRGKSSYGCGGECSGCCGCSLCGGKDINSVSADETDNAESADEKEKRNPKT